MGVVILVTVSTGHFDPLLKACDGLADRYAFFGQIGSGSFIPSFPYVRTLPPAELEKKMGAAELVISHAGTGMLSMLYRLKKRAVVIPKQIRYGESNDGQVELGRKWAELGMAVLCMNVEQLPQAIEKAFAFTPRFPEFFPLGRDLVERLGWSHESHSPIAERSSAL